MKHKNGFRFFLFFMLSYCGVRFVVGLLRCAIFHHLVMTLYS